MEQDIYVVVTERDTRVPGPDSKPIVFEQNVDNASLDAAKMRQLALCGAYGKTRIAKLVFVDDNQSHEKFYFVWNPNGSTPKYRHFSEVAARTEAARLAGMNPGQEFIVLESLCSCEAKPAEFTDHIEPEIPF